MTRPSGLIARRPTVCSADRSAAPWGKKRAFGLRFGDWLVRKPHFPARSPFRAIAGRNQCDALGWRWEHLGFPSRGIGDCNGGLLTERRLLMTFTEAAAQVLRLVGKPLHYKEITDVAIDKNLLSHVGKSPEVTMGARLAAMVKKDDKANVLVRVKPGVFALKEWDEAKVTQGLADRTPALELAKRAEEEQGEEQETEASEPPTEAEPVVEEEVEAPPAPAPEVAKAPLDAEEKQRAEIVANATEYYAPEDDDDEPIFGAAKASPSPEEETSSRKRRRRRRRGGRGNEEGRSNGDELPGYTVSDAPLPVEAKPAAESGSSTSSRRQVSSEENLAEWAFSSLSQNYGRSTTPVGIGRLGEGRGKGPDQNAVLTALRVDNLRHRAAGKRPRFRIVGSRVALTDWSMDAELLRLEKEIWELGRRYQQACRKVLTKRISDLPVRAVGELGLLLLESLGVKQLKPLRRPGAPNSELHLTGRLQGPLAEVPVAVVIRRDGREVGRERVMELRGTLHHYGPAHAGFILTTGQVLSGAREEAQLSSAAPVTLIDGHRLAELCEEHGVLMQTNSLRLSVPDMDVFESLRS